MDSEHDFCGPPVKRQCLDEEDLEMVNYEMPMLMYVPGDTEVDPLMPVETKEEPVEITQPSSSFYFTQPIKSEPEVIWEIPDDTDESESFLPKIDSVISNFVVAGNQLCDSYKNEVSGSTEWSDGSNNETSDFQEVTIEPKREISGRVSASEGGNQLVGENDQPKIQQHEQLLFNGLQQDQLMKPLCLKGSDELRTPTDPLDRVQKFVPTVNKPLPASQDGQPHTDTQQHQEHTLTPSHISLPAYGDRAFGTQSRDFHRVGRAELESHQIHPQPLHTYTASYESQNSSHQTAAVASAASVLSPLRSPEMKSPPITEPVSVAELLKSPFLGGFWTDTQKNAIIALSRPKPNIDGLTNISPRLFYDKIPWLCGCAYSRKFFCWPCLLFSHNSTNAELWSIPATLALNDGEFVEYCGTHESSQCHHDAAAKLLLQNPTAPLQPSTEKRNPSAMKDLLISRKVRRNRKLLSLLVQSVCYLRKEKLDARTVDYAECFTYVVLSKNKLQEALREFQGSPTLEVGSSTYFVFSYAYLVEKSIMKFMKSRVSEELKGARFVTLFMEDISGIVDKSAVATVAHFVDQAGDVQQRMIGLHEIGRDRSAGMVFALFRSVIQLGLRMKVAGFTYSSTLVHPSEIKTFNERVERLCPNAKCFHYQGHNLFGMLFGALSHLNCRNFFHSITELQVFFKKHLISTFHHFEQFSCAQSPQATYDFDYDFVTTLKRSYSSVLETFSSILRCPEEWDSAISSRAPIFMSFLQQTTTCFLITLISQLNLAIADLTKALQGKIVPADWKLKLHQAIANLISMKKYGFENIRRTAVTLVNETRIRANCYPQELVPIFNDIIDTAIVFLHNRFDSVDFGYVDFTSVATRYYARLRFKPDEVERFRLQVQFLVREPVIKGKSLAEALKTFYRYDLAKVVPDYVAFLIFAMTIPSSNTSLHCPAVERILKYQRDHSWKSSSEDLIWMEKELLADISREKKFTEAVIDILTTNEGTKEFSYESFEDLVVID